MRYEKIIERADKSKVLVKIDLYVESFRDEFSYGVQIATKGFRKQKWNYISVDNSLAFKDRPKDRHERNLKIVTFDEIQQAKLECWELLKPVKDGE